MANRTKYTANAVTKICDTLAGGWSITAACRAANITRRTYYDWLDEHPEFRKLAEEAIEAGTDGLEDVAADRAMERSDQLLMFLLKSRRPDLYRERTETRLTGDAEQPLPMKIEVIS